MALIDKIQQNLATAGTQQQGNTDQTGRARTLLAAKSGKQIGAGQLAPASAVGEAAAIDQTNQQMAALQPQGQVAAAEIGQAVKQLGAQETGARADLALRQKQLQQSNLLRKQQLLGDLGRDRATLDLEKDRAKLEQLAFTMRMNDKQYLDQLEMEGTRQRLDNDLNFKEELQKSIMGSNDELLKQSLGNRDIMAAGDREFAEAMGAMDINAALQMASNEARDAKAAATIGAAGGLATAAVGAYGQYKPGTSTTSTAPANAGTTQAHGGPGSSDVAGSSWKSGV